jgi:hypothetical protein
MYVFSLYLYQNLVVKKYSSHQVIPYNFSAIFRRLFLVEERKRPLKSFMSIRKSKKQRLEVRC